MSVRTISINTFGGPEVLMATTTTIGKAANNQVLIAVETCGVGLVDVIIRKGMLPGLNPAGFIPGVEVAGKVIGGEPAWIGNRVFAKTKVGGYTAQLIADTTDITEIPDDLSSEAAVALGINALVGHFSLQQAHCQQGEYVLVRGAGGGIGSLAIQLARCAGAHVTAATTSAAKRQRLAEIGVQQFDDDRQEYDIIIDPVAGPAINSFAARMKPNGRYVLNGIAGGFPQPDFAQELLISFQKSPSFSFLSLDSISSNRMMTAMAEIFEMAVQGRINPVIDNIFPLEEAAEAHKHLESGNVFGKVLLKV